MSNACWKVSEVYEGATFRRVCASFILCCFSFCRFLQSQKKPFMLCCTLNAFSLKYKMERDIGTEDDIFFTVKTVEWNEDTEPFAKSNPIWIWIWIWMMYVETVATEYDWYCHCIIGLTLRYTSLWIRKYHYSLGICSIPPLIMINGEPVSTP